MVNLCVLMIYLVSKFIFIECSTSFGFNLFSFPFFYLTLILASLQPKVKPFNSCITYNICSNGDEIEKQVYGRTYSLIEFEIFKHMSPKHMSVGVYINDMTYHFGMV